MVLNYTDMDITKLGFSANVANKNGRKTAAVTYDGKRIEEVPFQLGNPNETLRCPFGVDTYPKTGPPESMSMKLELTPEVKEFLKAFEGKTVEAATDHSVKWFGKEMSYAQLETTFSSRVKAQSDADRPDTLTLKVEFGTRKTSVVVVEWNDGMVTKPVPASLDDIKAGAMVVPIVRVQGGVYFMGPGGKNFGTSMVAAAVMIVKGSPPDAGSSSVSSSSLGFDMGGVETVDEEGEEGSPKKVARVA
jgi:hypothetical protein